MAFGDIKGTKTGSATSITASFPCSTGTNFAVVVGDLIVSALAEQTAKTVTACTDNLGNTYTAIGVGADAGTVTGRAFYTRVTNAGTISSVTFTATASSNNCVGLAVGFEGPFATSPLDAAPTAIINDNTTPYTCPATGVLAQADEKIVCLIVHNGAPTFTATSPNLKAVELATASVLKAALGHQTVTSTASVTPAWTSSATPTASGYGTASFKKELPPATADAWNVYDKSAGVTLSDGDKTATIAANISGVRSTQKRLKGAAGKYYAEFLCTDTSSTSVRVGISNSTVAVSDLANGAFHYASTGIINVLGSTVGTIASFGDGTVICLAWDSSAGLVWFRQNNGLWNNSGSADPATGTGGINTSALAAVEFALWAYETTGSGDPAIVTLRTEAAELTYSGPSGFTSWMGEELAAPSEPTGTLDTDETADDATLTGTVAWPEITGPFAVTEAEDDATATGAVTWTATLDVDETADDATMDGTVEWLPVTGMVTAPETADDATMAGAVAWPEITGPFAVIETEDDATLAGSVTWLTTLAVSETPDDATMAGAVAWTIALATTEDADDATLAGTVTWQAALATTEVADDATMAGAVAWITALVVTETADHATMAGTVAWEPVTGTATLIEAADDATFDGSAAFDLSTGTLTAFETPDDATMAGAVTWTVLLDADETPDDATMAGQVQWLATLTSSESPDSFAASGLVLSVLTGTMTAPETADDATMAGTVLSGLGGTVAASETADDATMAGSVTGYAGTLTASEAADTAAFNVRSEWFGTLATTEAPNTAIFSGAVFWQATLAVSEAADTASFSTPGNLTGTLTASEVPDAAGIAGSVRWLGVMGAAEGADGAAAAGRVAWAATLAAADLSDRMDGAGTAGWRVILAAVETPDGAAFAGGALTGAVLAASEQPDQAAFTEAPVSIQEADGHFLRSSQPRARALACGSSRIRSLKYPVPRPRDLRNNYGPRVRDLDGRRTRTLEVA